MLQGREDEALRRAFDVQMRIVGDVRRELEAAEARRLRDRGRDRENESGAGDAESGVDRQRRLRRRRRRRPREVVDSDDERRRREHRDARSRPVEDDWSEHTSEAASRPRRGFRTFLNDTIDVTDYVLFGGSSKRRG